MPGTPLVSVIVPCYNYGRFLADALESIRAQTYAHWECMVVDDGSTDNTAAVATGFAQKDARIKYIHQANAGVSAARNRALKEVKGQYIQLLDADDMLEREKLALQVDFFKAHPDVDLIYSSLVFFKDGDTANRSQPKLLHGKAPVSASGEALLSALLDDNLFLPGCTLARRSLYDEVGLFRTGIEGIEDWDYMYRAALLQKTFHHDDREGTRLLARNHGTNASANSHKMLTHKIKARTLLMLDTNALRRQRPSVFSKSFIARAFRVHTALLNRDRARLNLFYGNVFAGSINVLKHAYHSRRPYYALHDGAYWIKERLKRKLKAG